MRAKLPVLVVIAGLLGPAMAFAHRERPSYWPDPAADTSVTPPAGTRKTPMKMWFAPVVVRETSDPATTPRGTS